MVFLKKSIKQQNDFFFLQIFITQEYKNITILHGYNWVIVV
jgi:hypothetical protein